MKPCRTPTLTKTGLGFRVLIPDAQVMALVGVMAVVGIMAGVAGDKILRSKVRRSSHRLILRV